MEAVRLRRLITQVQAYQQALNQADFEMAVSLFHEEATINDEGVQFLVRPFLSYMIGTLAQINLSDFSVARDRLTCVGHTLTTLDKVLGFEGKSRKVQFTFRGERVAKMVISSTGATEQQHTRDREQQRQTVLFRIRVEQARLQWLGKRVSVVDQPEKTRKAGVVRDIDDDGTVQVEYQRENGEPPASMYFSVWSITAFTREIGLIFLDEAITDFPPYLFRVSFDLKEGHGLETVRHSWSLAALSQEDASLSFQRLLAGREGGCAIKEIACLT
jgi:hypothetical protein